MGIDIGGTKVAAGLVDGDGDIVARAEAPSDLSEASAVIRQVAVLCEQLRGGADVAGVGIGAAGVVDHATGHYVFGPNTGLADIDLVSMVSEATGLAVRLDNDANCAAWAEHSFGAGRGADHFMCVTLGTGIGGGFVFNGQRYRGAHGGAAEIGHILVDPNGPLCGCGRRGCWEQYASGLALTRRASEVLGRELKGPEVTKAARGGDPKALGVVDEVARWVGWGLGSLVNVLEPEVIAIAGGISRDWDLFSDAATEAMVERIEAASQRPLPRLVVAELGPDAGLVGAALLILGG